jgi:hypothetical protein
MIMLSVGCEVGFKGEMKEMKMDQIDESGRSRGRAVMKG